MTEAPEQPEEIGLNPLSAIGSQARTTAEKITQAQGRATMIRTIREVPANRRLQFAIVLPFALLVLWVLAKAQERSERV